MGVVVSGVTVVAVFAGITAPSVVVIVVVVRAVVVVGVIAVGVAVVRACTKCGSLMRFGSHGCSAQTTSRRHAQLSHFTGANQVFQMVVGLASSRTFRGEKCR